jgi:ABC-type multidrug transport system ATPase subunit
MNVRLTDVTKIWGNTIALDQLNLNFSPGEIVCVLGLNGVGKSTLLRMLAGVFSPTYGELAFDGIPFKRNDLTLRRKIGFLPDFPIFLPGPISVIRHIGMVLRLYEKDYAGVEHRVLEILRGLDLLEVVESNVLSLSRGQQYKTALAGLMAVEPELLLLDEPFASGMDAHGLSVLKLFGREMAAKGKTVIYTTQILEIAEQWSNRVLVLDRGAVYAFDSISNLLSFPGDDLNQLFKRLREVR